MESWASIGGKESHTNMQILAEPGSNWGSWGRKTEILQQGQPYPLTLAPSIPKQMLLLTTSIITTIFIEETFSHKVIFKKDLTIYKLINT